MQVNFCVMYEKKQLEYNRNAVAIIHNCVDKEKNLADVIKIFVHAGVISNIQTVGGKTKKFWRCNYSHFKSSWL